MTDNMELLRAGDALYHAGEYGHAEAVYRSLMLSCGDDLTQTIEGRLRLLDGAADRHGITESNFHQVKGLARNFCRIISEALADNLDEINERNKTIGAGSCATQDFCDANDLMDSAWLQTFSGSEMFPSDDDAPTHVIDRTRNAICDVLNAAWGMARKAEFDAAKVPE